MVKLALRMRKLKSLLHLRLGAGAAILPPEITRIHMDFAFNIHDGHYGPRKFWRHCLPRLKYHNPTISMTVARTENQEGPALMSIHYASPSADTPTPGDLSLTTAAPSDLPIQSTASKKHSSAPVTASRPGPSTVRVEQINMKHRSESEILEQLLKLTQARTVKATADELRELAEIEEANRRAEAHAAKAAQLNEAKKRERMLLQQATSML